MRDHPFAPDATSPSIPWEFPRPPAATPPSRAAHPATLRPPRPERAFRTVILVQAPTYTRPSGGISFFWPVGTGVFGSAPTASAT